MEIITGYTGENHVTSADDASLYRGILGTGDYVLDVGNKFAATIIDNNTVRIMDGDLVIQGHQARIRANDYNEVTIDNGTPGEKRNDLIVARYQKNTTTGVESITLEVVKGTPGETAVDPDIVQEDLTTGGTQREFALYRVSLNGLVLESVTSLFTVLPNLKAFKTHLAENVSDDVHGLAWGDYTNLTLQNGWTGTLRVRRHSLDLVHIYGEITPGVTDRGTTITSVPTIYRPGWVTPLPAQSIGINIGAISGLVVTTSGNINIYGSASDDIGQSNVRINYIYRI